MHDSPDLPAAPVLGERYEISRRLREEPWGEVWLARDRLLGAEVGLKVLPREAPEWSAAQGYYEQEAALGLRLRHPVILGVYHLERIANCLFLVEESFEGETLLTQFVRQQRFSLPQALLLLEQLSQALALAHQQGGVHQALNPLNILLKGEEVRLANFAFPREDGSQVLTLELKAYDAPEVIYGDTPTPASNLFSLGVLGYRLVAGSLPYPLTFDEPFPYRLETLPVDLDEIPMPLQNLLLRCLSVDPEERFPNVAGFLAQLRQVQEQTRGGRPADYQAWQPTKAGPAWKQAAAGAAGLLGKLWQLSKSPVRLTKEAALKAGGRLLSSPKRQLWVLGLVCLITLLIMVGLRLNRPGPAVPTTVTAAAVKLPPAAEGGPPLTENEGPVSFQPSRGKPSSTHAAAPVAGAAPEARQERFMIVAATFANRQQAKALQQRLRQSHTKTKIVSRTGGGKTLYQVQLGPVIGSQAAEDLAQRLKSQEKLTPRVVKMSSKHNVKHKSKTKPAAKTTPRSASQ
jgi:cell division septation protein DedD